MSAGADGYELVSGLCMLAKNRKHYGMAVYQHLLIFPVPCI